MIKRNNLILVATILFIILEGQLKSYLGINLLPIMILTVGIGLFSFMGKKNIAFSLYICVLLVILLFRGQDNFISNLSLDTLKRWTPLVFQNKTIFVNIFGNIFIYVPMGYFLAKYFNLLKTLVFTNVFIIGIEIIQLLFNVGIFDIGDIILNTIGIILGYFLCKVWRWFIWERKMMKSK